MTIDEGPLLVIVQYPSSQNSERLNAMSGRRLCSVSDHVPALSGDKEWNSNDGTQSAAWP